MSKIQINELNQNASEFEVLNAAETTEVVGGWYSYYKPYGGYYYSSYSDDDFIVVNQSNKNSTQQVSFYGPNYNSTYQNNSANIYA